MKNKKIIVILSIIVIILSVGLTVYTLVTKLDTEDKIKIDDIKINTNKEVLKETTINNLKISDVSLITRNGVSKYKSVIVNETDADILVSKLYATFYVDEVETTMLALSNVTIKSGTKVYINITSEKDLSETSKITYSISDKAE